MLLSKILRTCYRQFSSSVHLLKRLPGVHDEKSPLKILKDDIFDGKLRNYLPCPRETDVAIIGGSVIGSSAAYFIKQQMNKMEVVVIEPDPTYAKASALLSAAGMRQQFSTKENVLMSQFGYEFLRHAPRLLAINEDFPPEVQFNHAGYLILADKDQAEVMIKNHQMQLEYGAKTILLTPEKVKQKFPWIDTDGVEVASYGLEGEGWFDPAALLSGLKGKARSLGVHFIQGKVVGFEHKKVQLGQGVSRYTLGEILVELPNGDIQPMVAPVVVNAAGAWAGHIARLAGIGSNHIDADCSIPLPVEPRKRYIYTYHSPNGPGLSCPLVTDQTQGSVYFRREGLGGTYICGFSPRPDQEPDCNNLDVDYEPFDQDLWPKLAKRVPAFENLKLKSAWAGYYDYNYVDHNLIIGNHPYFNNMLFANGSSGHGLQHSIAIGNAIMELIIHDDYRLIDLKELGFERFVEKEFGTTESETNIY